MMQKAHDRFERQAHPLSVADKATSRSKWSSIKRVRDADLPMAPLTDKQEAKLAIVHDKAGQALQGVREGKPKATSEALRDCKTTRDLVQKKREMFLVQMALDVKKAEMLKLDEEALTESMRQLEE